MNKKEIKKNTNVKKKTVSVKNKNVNVKKNKDNSKIRADNKILFGVIVFLGLVIFALLLGGSYEEKWVQKGDVVSKGNEKYLIGDYYHNYDETIDGERKDVVDVNWKVLGVDKDGHLLIVSASNAWNLELGSEDNISEAQDDFVTGASQINEICQRYGYGNGAVGARSITFDDIVNVFDVEKKYYSILYDEFTYNWGSNGKLISVNSNDDEKSNDLYTNGYFLWFDEKANEWKLSVYNGEYTDSNKSKIVTLKDKLRALNSLAYDEELQDYVEIFKGNEKKSAMLFKDESGEKTSYWTSDRFVHATPNFVGHGYNVVKGDSVNYNFLVYSIGKTRKEKFGIRPVIMIK